MACRTCGSSLQTFNTYQSYYVAPSSSNCEVTLEEILFYKNKMLDLKNNFDAQSTYTMHELNIWIGYLDSMLNTGDYCLFNIDPIK